MLYDAPGATPRDARHATGVPREGDPHPQDVTIPCVSIEARPLSPTLFEVTVEYERTLTAVAGTDPQPPANPLDEPAVYTYATEATQELVDRAANDYFLANVNDEPFDPPMTNDVFDELVSISRLQSSFSGIDMRQYIDSVNANAMFGGTIGVGEALMRRIHAQSEIHASESGIPTTYWRVQFEFAIRQYVGPPEAQILIRADPQPPPAHRAWWRTVANIGFKARPEPGLPPVWVKDADKNLVALPVRLADDGTQLADGELTWWLQFQMKRSVNWAPLNL